MKKKVLGIVFALVLVLSISLVTAVPLGAQAGVNYYVDASTGDDTASGSIGDPWETIQHAVNTVPAESTIIVAAGSYKEQVTIGKSLTLMGESRDGVIIDGELFQGEDNIKGIWIKSSDVTVKDLTVENFGPQWCYSILAIEQVDNEGGAHPVDIATEGKTLLPLENVRIENVKFNNLGNTTGPYLVYSKSSTVKDCFISGQSDDGIWMSWGCDNARIVGNEVIDSGDQGIWLGAHWKGSPPVTTNGVIRDNIVNTAREAGIWFAGNGCIIENNEVTNIKGEGYSNGAVTLGVTDATSNVVVRNNKIHDNATHGIGISAASDVSQTYINYNGIYGNTGYGLKNETGTLVDATNNWWGTKVGSEIEAMVSGPVNYSPWLTSEWPSQTVSLTATPPAEIIGISVLPSEIDFGAIQSGATVSGAPLTVTNVGNTLVEVSAQMNADTTYDDNTLFFYTTALKLNDLFSDKYDSATALGNWTKTDLELESIAVDGFGSVTTELVCPSYIRPGITYTGTILFVATAVE